MALGSRRACADTLEPWPDCHKPLVAYLLIGFVNLLLGLFLELHGFELQRVGRLAYWARPARESMLRPPPPPPMPLVVLHGVLGLLPYALMLRQLSREHDGAVLAPLFPHCAVQLEHLCSALPPPLDATELVATIRSMVARYTHVESAVQASFVAHSLGTGYLALLCRRAPELPAAVAFIDPICFLLPDGHVLRNYLYQPVTLGLSTWFHWLQRYLVADEPTQQDYFRNIFWWASSWIHPSELRASAHHGALSSPRRWASSWLHPSELPCDALVLLSGRDSLVSAPNVFTHLKVWQGWHGLTTGRYAASAHHGAPTAHSAHHGAPTANGRYAASASPTSSEPTPPPSPQAQCLGSPRSDQQLHLHMHASWTHGWVLFSPHEQSILVRKLQRMADKHGGTKAAAGGGPPSPPSPRSPHDWQRSPSHLSAGALPSIASVMRTGSPPSRRNTKRHVRFSWEETTTDECETASQSSSYADHAADELLTAPISAPISGRGPMAMPQLDESADTMMWLQLRRGVHELVR